MIELRGVFGQYFIKKACTVRACCLSDFLVHCSCQSLIDLCHPFAIYWFSKKTEVLPLVAFLLANLRFCCRLAAEEAPHICNLCLPPKVDQVAVPKVLQPCLPPLPLACAPSEQQAAGTPTLLLP